MPSLSELEARRRGEPIPAPDEIPPPPAPDHVLAAIKAEGGRRRARRYRRNAAVAMIGLVAVALPALALLPGDDDGNDELTVAAESTTTDAPSTTERDKASTSTTVATTGTTVVATTDTVPGTAPATPTTVRRGPTTTAVPTPTTAPLVCQNSVDPACGPFFWDPAPAANQPLAASFTSAPATAVVGEEVTFVVQWSDPDANAIGDHFSADGTVIGGPCSTAVRYGPWTPPAASPGSGSLTYRHTFTAAGTYQVDVSAWTGNVCDHPYASDTHITTTIEITAPPPPEP